MEKSDHTTPRVFSLMRMMSHPWLIFFLQMVSHPGLIFFLRMVSHPGHGTKIMRGEKVLFMISLLADIPQLGATRIILDTAPKL